MFLLLHVLIKVQKHSKNIVHLQISADLLASGVVSCLFLILLLFNLILFFNYFDDNENNFSKCFYWISLHQIILIKRLIFVLNLSLKVDSIHHGVITHIVEFGVFVSIAPGLRGLVPCSVWIYIRLQIFKKS